MNKFIFPKNNQYVLFWILSLLVVACVFAVFLYNFKKSSVDKKSQEDILFQSQLIEISVRDAKSGNYSTAFYDNEPNLTEIKKWISNHAWPPIDPYKVGAVLPRGYFTIFESPSVTSSSFRIYIYGSTSRDSPGNTHVSSEAWNALQETLE